MFTANATGMGFNQANQAGVTHGGTICEDGSVEDETNHRVERAHTCCRRYSQMMYDHRRNAIAPFISRHDFFKPKLYVETVL